MFGLARKLAISATSKIALSKQIKEKQKWQCQTHN